MKFLLWIQNTSLQWRPHISYAVLCTGGFRHCSNWGSSRFQKKKKGEINASTVFSIYERIGMFMTVEDAGDEHMTNEHGYFDK